MYVYAFCTFSPAHIFKNKNLLINLGYFSLHLQLIIQNIKSIHKMKYIFPIQPLEVTCTCYAIRIKSCINRKGLKTSYHTMCQKTQLFLFIVIAFNSSQIVFFGISFFLRTCYSLEQISFFCVSRKEFTSFLSNEGRRSSDCIKDTKTPISTKQIAKNTLNYQRQKNLFNKYFATVNDGHFFPGNQIAQCNSLINSGNCKRIKKPEIEVVYYSFISFFLLFFMCVWKNVPVTDSIFILVTWSFSP